MEASIHAGQSAQDHHAAVVSVQLRFQASASGLAATRTKQRRFDEAAMLTPEGQEALVNVLHSLPAMGHSC